MAECVPIVDLGGADSSLRQFFLSMACKSAYEQHLVALRYFNLHFRKLDQRRDAHRTSSKFPTDTAPYTCCSVHYAMKMRERGRINYMSINSEGNRLQCMNIIADIFVDSNKESKYRDHDIAGMA